MKLPNRRTLLVNLAWMLVFAVVYVGIRFWQHRDLVHGVAPTFQAVTLDGQSISLVVPRDKPVLLHFWASWCRICRMEQASVDSIARDYDVITVAIDGSDPDALRRYVEHHDIKAPVIADQSGLAARYGIRGVPTDLVVDAKGQIRFVEVGYSTEWGLRARLWLAGSS
jgi:thiol-disulfide isomerase/thioredoxin